MKTVQIYTSDFEARLVAGKLESEGFTVFINGAREYSSIVLGGPGEGRYELQVPDDQAEKATKTLAKYAKKSAKNVPIFIESDKEPAPPETSANRALKKSVVFSLLGVTMVPLVFNYYSMQHAAVFARLEKSSLKKAFWLTLITFCNTISVWIGLSGVAFFMTRQ